MTGSESSEITLAVKVQPNASKTEFSGWMEDGTLKIRIQSPPQDGKANKALLAFLAKSTGVSKNQLSILRGETSRQKVIAFRDLTPSQWQRIPRQS